MVCKIMGLAEGGDWKGGLAAGGELETVAVHGFVVGAAVCAWVSRRLYGGGDAMDDVVAARISLL